MTKIENKSIIIISPDSWEALPVSKHHYAKELSKHNNVYFVNTPNNEKDIKINNLTIINEYRKVKGLRFLPIFLRKHLMKLEINSILNKIKNKKVDIVWSFDTSRLYFLDLFGASTKIAHIVDFSEHFNFKELCKSADYCFSVSDSIINKINKYNKNSFKINHGYYNETSKNITDIRLEKNKLTAIYIGNLDMKFIDWMVFKKLVQSRKDINFILIGNYTQKLINENNVIFIGKKSPDEVKEYIRLADFCLVFYLSHEYPDQSENSHKVLQYLGSGKPIFSSYIHEYKDSNLFYMYDRQSSIEKQFNEFLSNSRSDFSEESRLKRINFALDNTYPKQIERIAQIIQNNK